MRRSISLCCVLGFFLIGCGSSIQSIDKQQQYRFSMLVGNVGKIMTAVQATGQRHGGKTPLAGNTGGSRDQDTEELMTAIEKAMTRGDCKVPRAFPADLGFPNPDLKAPKAPSLYNSDFVIEGAKCPIALRFQMIAKGGGKYNQGNYELKYEALDPKVKGILDLNKLEMTGQVTVTVASVLTTKWSMEGDFRSDSEGTVRASLKMDSELKASPPAPQNSKVEFSLSLGFKDFRGQLRANSQEIYLNTQKLTSDEFAKLFPFPG
jgi:hypothetical protein